AVDDPLARAEVASVLGIAEVRRGRPGIATSALVGAARGISAVGPRRGLEVVRGAAWAAVEESDPPRHAEVCGVAARRGGSAPDASSAFILSLLRGLGAIAANDMEVAVGELGRVIAAGAEDDDPGHVIWAGSAALGLDDEDRARALYARGAAI